MWLIHWFYGGICCRAQSALFPRGHTRHEHSYAALPGLSPVCGKTVVARPPSALLPVEFSAGDDLAAPFGSMVAGNAPAAIVVAGALIRNGTMSF